MLQDFLAVLFQVVAIVAIAIFTIDFCSMLRECWQQAALPAQPIEPTSQLDPEVSRDPIATIPVPKLSLLPEGIVALQPVMDTIPSKAKPKKRRTQIEVAPAALTRLSAVQLRQQCSASGIQWRNARGKGKHLTKQEMIDRLTA